ncbi:hypothetical protein FRC12_017210 [Ceratobasidium sp. 428]|nr:hypothetical protein FRC12_017210 [Ceratobasidium sp. 428]
MHRIDCGSQSISWHVVRYHHPPAFTRVSRREAIFPTTFVTKMASGSLVAHRRKYALPPHSIRSRIVENDKGQGSSNDALVGPNASHQKTLPPVPEDSSLQASLPRWWFDSSLAPASPSDHTSVPTIQTDSHNEPLKSTSLRRRGALCGRGAKSRSRDTTRTDSPQVLDSSSKTDTDQVQIQHVSLLADIPESILASDLVANTNASPDQSLSWSNLTARRSIRRTTSHNRTGVSQPQTSTADFLVTSRPSTSRQAIPTCSICLDLSDDLPRDPPTSNCTHKPTVCRTCLEQYVSHAVQSGGLTTFPCPDAECKQTMEYLDIKKGAGTNKQCLERYEALLVRRLLQNEPNFVWCKNPLCDSGQIHESGDASPVVVCKVCSAESCFKHDTPWHTGLTCGEYDNRRRNTHAQADFDSYQYLERKTKICPNRRCGRRVSTITRFRAFWPFLGTIETQVHMALIWPILARLG